MRVNKKLLTVQELAEVLNTNPRHIYSLSERGLIPRVKLGALVRFNPEEVLEHLRQPASTKSG
jgi:excisionase family DNA binding protein